MSKKASEGTDILGLVTLGLILILFTILIIIIPNVGIAFVTFFSDLQFTQVTPWFWFWVPSSPHPIVYNALYLFFLGTIIINTIVFILRLIFKDAYRRVLESLGGIIFSIGTTWAAYSLLNGTMNFLVFFGFLILFGGVSVVISSLGWILIKILMK